MCFFDVVLRDYGVKLHDKLAIGWALVVFSDGFGNFFILGLLFGTLFEVLAFFYVFGLCLRFVALCAIVIIGEPF